MKAVFIVTLVVALIVFAVVALFNVPVVYAAIACCIDVDAGPDQTVVVQDLSFLPKVLIPQGCSGSQQYCQDVALNRVVFLKGAMIPRISPSKNIRINSVEWTQIGVPKVDQIYWRGTLDRAEFDVPMPIEKDIVLKFKLEVKANVYAYNYQVLEGVASDFDTVSITLKPASKQPITQVSPGVTIDKTIVPTSPPPEEEPITPAVPMANQPADESLPRAPVLPPVTTEEQSQPQVADEVPVGEPILPPVTAADEEAVVPTEPPINQPPPEEVPSEPLLPPASDELSPTVSKEQVLPPEDSKLQPSEEIQKAPIEPPVTEQEHSLPIEPQVQSLIEGEVINPQMNNTNTTISSEPTPDKIGSSDKTDIPDLEKKKKGN